MSLVSDIRELTADEVSLVAGGEVMWVSQYQYVNQGGQEIATLGFEQLKRVDGTNNWIDTGIWKPAIPLGAEELKLKGVGEN